jgi:hypothetical protein
MGESKEVGLEPRKYRIGVEIHLKRFPEPGPRAEENKGWIVASYLPNGQYLIKHSMGGVANVREEDIAFQVKRGRNKAPNPRAYWLGVVAQLLADHSSLYAEVINAKHCRWNSSDIAYAHGLARRIIAKLGNPYGYAESTWIASLKRAIHQREWQSRRERQRGRTC